MRLPKNILGIVIEHLDPSEGSSTTKTLSSLCLTSKLLLDLARPQLYSTIRIDDMRCTTDYSTVTVLKIMSKMMSTVVPNEVDDPAKAQRRPAWIDTLFREKEYEIAKKKWQEEQRLKRETRPEEEDDDFEMFNEPDEFDERDEDSYQDPDQWPERPQLEYLSWGPTDILDPFSYRQLLSLEAQPHLARLVKKLDFQGRIEGKPTSIIIERFLTTCPNVETILLYRGAVRFLEDYPRVVEAIARQAPNVKNLEIVDFNEDGSEKIFQAISNLSNLSHLSLTSASRHQIGFSDSFYLTSLSTRTLTSLYLGTIAAPDFYDSIPSHFLESITSLGVAVRRQSPDLSKFKNLHHLTVTYGYTSHAIETLETVSSTNEIISLELRLSDTIYDVEWKERKYEREDLWQDSDDDELDDDDEEEEGGGGGSDMSSEKGKKNKKRELDSLVDLFDYLPSKLENLSIPWYLPEEVQEELRVAVETKLPPSLQKVSLLGSMGNDEDDELEEVYDNESEEACEARIKAEREEKKRNRVETWLDKISKYLSEEKGVEVYRVKHWDGERSERSALMRFASSFTELR